MRCNHFLKRILLTRTFSFAVPIYDTFGETECQYICKQAELQVIFVARGNLEKIIQWTINIPSVQKIIVWGATADETLPSSGERVLSYQQCLDLGVESQPSMASPPQPEDLASIMYTSGTT